MARRCEISGRGTASGNKVSHSHRKTRRTFKVNIISSRIWDEEAGRWVHLKVSSRLLRTIRKKGLAAVRRDYA
ncbi:50S ribosomal protein L28 [bacterium]|nr:50S ribosomal protein L28 [bacterium]